MKQGMIAWGRSQAPGLLAGIVVWTLLAVGGYAYAQSQNAPIWPTIVTWDEWVAAILLLPRVTILALGTMSFANDWDDGVTRATPRANQLATIGLVIFLLDLVVRSVYGLGWKPF